MAGSIRIISRENRQNHSALIQDMYRMRHRVLVEDYGWNEIRQADGVERDVVDHDETLYIIAADGEDALGCIRITPSDAPTLSTEVFFDLFNLEPLPRAELIYDSSRIVVDPKTRDPGALSHTASDIMCAWYEAGLALGLEAYTGVIETRYLTLCLATGWDIQPMGTPTRINDDEIIACRFPVTEAALETVRSLRGVDGTLLDEADRAHLIRFHENHYRKELA